MFTSPSHDCNCLYLKKYKTLSRWSNSYRLVQSAGVVEYIDWITPINDCPGYDT